MTFIEFINYYFSINLSDYPAIGIDLQINKIIFLFLIGMIVAIIIVNIRRESESRLIKKLLRHHAFDDESAKTLGELSLNNYITKLSLSEEGRIAKIVKRVGAKEYTYEEYNEAIKSKDFKEEKIDFNTARFFIHNESIDEANRIAEIRNTSVINTILLCLFVTIVFVCIIIAMPELLSLINRFLTK